VAKAVGVATRPMGRLIGKHGIRATKAHRGGKQGRYFTFKLRDRTGELPGYNRDYRKHDTLLQVKKTFLMMKTYMNIM
jgi:hypothetical protein